MTPFRIALANVRFPATLDDSIALATGAVERAGAAGARIVCFPECFVPGYRGLGKAVMSSTPELLELAWSAIAQAAAGAAVSVVLGSERHVQGALVATSLIIDAGG